MTRAKKLPKTAPRNLLVAEAKFRKAGAHGNQSKPDAAEIGIKTGKIGVLDRNRTCN